MHVLLVGIVCVLGIVTLRQETAGAAEGLRGGGGNFVVSSAVSGRELALVHVQAATLS